MKKTLKLMALALLAGAGLVIAADDAKPKKDAAKRKSPMAADANADKKVSLEELTAWGAARQPKPMKEKAVKAMFARLDGDKDGFLTSAEIKAGRKKKGAGAAADQPEGGAKKEKQDGQ